MQKYFKLDQLDFCFCKVSSKAVVSLEPSWPLIFSGEKITVRCQISLGGSTEWEYEWSKPDSSTVMANNAYLNLNASVISSGSYRCMGKNKQELYAVTEWSDVITLTVSGKKVSFCYAYIRHKRNII